MQILNRYFTPFAAFLILAAVIFSRPDRTTTWISIGFLALSIVVNHWLAFHSYRYIHWTRRFRFLQVWLNYLWSIPLVYLLGGWWGPMWLLLLMAPATSALYFGHLHTFVTGFVSGLTLLGIYKLRGLQGGSAWGQAFVHAVFIVFFGMFVHTLAQMALRMRDAMRGGPPHGAP